LSIYFDTSALIKLVIQEQESDMAAALWDGADAVITSRLAYAEARAALAAAHRLGRLTSRDHATAKRAFEAVWRELRLLELGKEIVRAAGELAEQLALRGYDAVHLASALAASGGDFVLATWDRDLGSAALALGLAVAPPI
jgi:uncharacterized protein